MKSIYSPDPVWSNFSARNEALIGGTFVGGKSKLRLDLIKLIRWEYWARTFVWTTNPHIFTYMISASSWLFINQRSVSHEINFFERIHKPWASPLSHWPCSVNREVSSVDIKISLSNANTDSDTLLDCVWSWMQGSRGGEQMNGGDASGLWWYEGRSENLKCDFN